MIRHLLVAGLLAGAVLLGGAAPDPDVAVVVLGHAIDPQDRLAASDFVEARVPAGTARGALGLRDLSGMEAARHLASGSIVRVGDVVRLQLVRRGEPVTISVRAGTLVIRAAGRALSSGAAGAAVRVVSVSTNRTLDGIVDGPGAVRVIAN
ncbi:MAG: flagellar basal body P-ring formation protein FlgA [Tardiphaga sp.]|uniref:flagellar basal body P-ring formation chaperone FlgA n=1 Tax=Tardiphaga sp. TaxID=1926292 RepID=UPI0019A9E68F|nr:flagellar basal body P-ring formation chaperone FlgA [Tardiphaga sp.]MBC7583236.1 flagellar basal body P-ring formation protein FlgA [Tardiphaga sp.]